MRRLLRQWPWIIVLAAPAIGFGLRVIEDREAALLDIPKNVYAEPDTQSPWRIDPAKPYRITFTTGCLKLGSPDVTQSLTIDHTGRVGIGRLEQGSWVGTSVTLSPAAQARVLRAIESHHVMRLHGSYTGSAGCGGTKWELAIKQGEREKLVYCSTIYEPNPLPKRLIRFVRELDEIISSEHEVPWHISGMVRD